MSSTIATIFGKSPVVPLEQHMTVVCECASHLKVFFGSAIAADWRVAADEHAEIDRLEQEADELKRQIRLNMPRSLFMPVPREDLLALLLAQDRIANKAKAVSGVVHVREMHVPESIVEEFLAFVDTNVSAVEQAKKSVHELDELYTAAFGGSEAELVEQMIRKLDEIENDIDNRQLVLQSHLHSIESTLDPVTIVLLYEVITRTSEVGRAADSVGRRLELLLSR